MVRATSARMCPLEVCQSGLMYPGFTSVSSTRRDDRQPGEHVRRDADLPGDRPEVAPELLACPDGLSHELEELGEAAADLPLDRDRVEDELEVGRPDPAPQLGERVFERPAEVHLGDDPPELAARRLADVGCDALEPVVEPVARAQRGRERVEDLGQLLLERPRTPQSEHVQDEPRRDDRGDAAEERRADAPRVEQEPERAEPDQRVEADERAGAGVDARAVDVQLHRRRRAGPGEQRLDARAETLERDDAHRLVLARETVASARYGLS